MMRHAFHLRCGTAALGCVPVLLAAALIGCQSAAERSRSPLLAGEEPEGRWASVLNILDFGARGDGQTDDTAAVQKAIDAAQAAGGGVVFIPRGDFLIRTRLIVRENVTLKGIFEAPTARTQMRGSTLLAIDDAGGLEGQPFITLLANGTLKGLTVFYPQQSKDSPRPYPWTVRGRGDNCSIVDVLLVNPYAAVDFGTSPAGRHYINGLYAQALYRGVFVDKCFDVGRISNVHLWPFWSTDRKLMKWTEENGEAFIIGRTDWEYMNNCFCISYKTGFRFTKFKDGPGNAVLTQCGSDIGPCAVLVEDCQSHAGVSFVNGQFMAGINIAESNSGPVKFTASGFWGVSGVTGAHATLSGRAQTSFLNCHFIGWDQKKLGLPAIHAISGGLSVVGCDFMDEKNQIVLEKSVQSATIVANRLRGGQKIIDNTAGKAEIGLNSKS